MGDTWTQHPAVPEGGFPTEDERFTVIRGTSPSGVEVVTVVKRGQDREHVGPNGETKFADERKGFSVDTWRAILPAVEAALALSSDGPSPEELATAKMLADAGISPEQLAALIASQKAE